LTISSWPRPRWLALGGAAFMAWREVGPAQGPVWLLLHGGPGSGSHAGQCAPFGAHHRLVLPDQRGAGQSRPRGGLRGNHTDALVADLERLRVQLGVSQWALQAGSWGTVLALRYASRHPECVSRLVLRGAFGLRRREVEGVLQLTQPQRRSLGGLAQVWPRVCWAGAPARWARLEQLLQFATPNVTTRRVCRLWQWLEGERVERGLRRSLLHASPGSDAGFRAPWAVVRRQQRRAVARLAWPQASARDRANGGKYRIQARYLRHKGFVRPGQLDACVAGLARSGVMVHWIHGRFDAVCPPSNSRAWARLGADRGGFSDLVLSHAGHLGGDPQTLRALRSVVG
jgi:proline iminopeptidase